MLVHVRKWLCERLLRLVARPHYEENMHVCLIGRLVIELLLYVCATIPKKKRNVQEAGSSRIHQGGAISAPCRQCKTWHGCIVLQQLNSHAMAIVSQ